jgi:hypothetical protein
MVSSGTRSSPRTSRGCLESSLNRATPEISSVGDPSMEMSDYGKRAQPFSHRTIILSTTLSCSVIGSALALSLESLQDPTFRVAQCDAREHTGYMDCLVSSRGNPDGGRPPNSRAGNGTERLVCQGKLHTSPSILRCGTIKSGSDGSM